MVERRPEKAGVASSILAPGTIETAASKKIPCSRSYVVFTVRCKRDFLHVFGDLRANCHCLSAEERLQIGEARLDKAPRVADSALDHSRFGVGEFNGRIRKLSLELRQLIRDRRQIFVRQRPELWIAPRQVTLCGKPLRPRQRTSGPAPTYCGKVFRVITLPAVIDANRVSAHWQSIFLEIHLPIVGAPANVHARAVSRLLTLLGEVPFVTSSCAPRQIFAERIGASTRLPRRFNNLSHPADDGDRERSHSARDRQSSFRA